MVSNKKRLYVALYPSGTVNNEERRYHWAFLVGPKKEERPEVPGTRYHVKNLPSREWVYEEHRVGNVRSTTALLARILIGKVLDEERLASIFRSVPLVQNDPDWRCRTWIANALVEIEKDGKTVGTAMLDWSTIETVGRRYVGEKIAEGRYGASWDVKAPKPTWDLLKDQETVP